MVAAAGPVTRRTWWHLEGQRRKPSDYEIATSKLLYHPERGLEVEAPAAEWYRRYQRGSPFQCGDWERFADPRETTYFKYTTLQTQREGFVDNLLRQVDETGADRALTPEWLRTLSQVLAPLRYPVHGLQMAAAYVGQMAPSGRITVCAMLQAGDEVRRIQRLAYRLRQLQGSHPKLTDNGRMLWETDPAWQPLRETVEKLLVTWDFGEALVALNFAVKPVFDELFMVALGPLARQGGDDALQKMLLSLNEDCRWHREWSQALVRAALADRPANREVLDEWLARWRPQALGAARGFARIFEPFGGQALLPFAEVLRGLETLLDQHRAAAMGPVPGPDPSRQVA